MIPSSDIDRTAARPRIKKTAGIKVENFGFVLLYKTPVRIYITTQCVRNIVLSVCAEKTGTTTIGFSATRDRL